MVSFMAASATDFPSIEAEPTWFGLDQMRRRQRRVQGNLPAAEGLARGGAPAALHGWSIVPRTGPPRAQRIVTSSSALVG
jgi:hypothetical protein